MWGFITIVWNGRSQNSISCFVLLTFRGTLTSSFDSLKAFQLVLFFENKLGEGGGSVVVESDSRVRILHCVSPPVDKYVYKLDMNVIIFSLWEKKNVFGRFYTSEDLSDGGLRCCRSREMMEASGTEEADAHLIQAHRGSVGEGGGETRWGFFCLEFRLIPCV